MPHFQGAGGRIHYRRWLASQPRAAIIFLHGFGEHSGLYERLATALNASSIDLWALDELGHGLSDGARGDAGSATALESNARTLSAIAAGQRPGIPQFLAGHSLGGAIAALAATRDAGPWQGLILSGTPIVEPEWAAAIRTSGADGLALEPTDLSADAWYLDALANDELAFTDADGSPLDVLPEAWDALQRDFAELTLPVLFIHGSEDPVSPVQVTREWAQRLPEATLQEFPSARHDVLNETVHAQVATTIASWVLAQVATSRTAVLR